MILTYLEHRCAIINCYTEPLKESRLTWNVYKREFEMLSVQFILTFRGGAKFKSSKVFTIFINVVLFYYYQKFNIDFVVILYDGTVKSQISC